MTLELPREDDGTVSRRWLARQAAHADAHYRDTDRHQPACWCCCRDCDDVYYLAGQPRANDLLSSPWG